MQMIGMLLGGIVWGMLGDKPGGWRCCSGLFCCTRWPISSTAWCRPSSIYAFLRFVAGVGLAGELGAGITLVSEVLPKEKRGYGTMVVATVGVAGALLAGLVGE